ncbi:NtaA/DmoA family FMN-dependent monooxygenase [Leifsonia shinshuensis]|uniref:FMN-dependent oxidoreductase (Nitrilotriacetate monooxygenase family) n=1 Tax=Leifsonia shinshuensis TaxID=150026 RepID=A0A853CPB4_9MICO|nr:NtaA/DmoA family FMN-dependent monooxygenase [Leifsonia shinshuensis]NYJ22282.1 FMN-dependent oxidoreductase (nitrilotriacetate monooxygenase family) [Leifsonia shinshuensis]
MTAPTVLRFGVFFQGVNFSTVWTEPESGSQIDFESFRRLAQTAERGLFSAFFLGEGLRLREHLGRLHQLDVAGRPDAQTQLAALAAVTSRIGLVATQNTTYNDPLDLAHRFASLDLLSGGRAAWNVVTTDNAWTGENFRRGGYLDHADRYRHAEAVVVAAKELWAAWAADIADSPDADAWSAGAPSPTVEVDTGHYRARGRSRLPQSPQGRPVLFQAGDSAEGRDFAARQADVIFSAHSAFDDAQSFAADIRQRTLKAGRPADDVKIFPGQEFILADTDAEAEEKARWVRRKQVTPQTAIAFIENIWGTDLSGYDPDGPLPDIDPVQDVTGETRGAGFRAAQAKTTADAWRERAEAEGLSIRELVIRLNSGRGFVGSPSSVAATLQRYADAGVVDGFNITPWLVPSGMDDIVDRLVPELQERGIYPTSYEGNTLRENLGLRPLDSAALARRTA